jgi:adenine-specific DNA-methyltransferase
MSLTLLEPAKVLRKLQNRQIVMPQQLADFRKVLQGFLEKIQDKDRESKQETDLRDFLNQAFYKDKYYINKKENADWVIYDDHAGKGNVSVIVEVKNTSEKNDMMTNTKPNVKALHELIRYYLHERLDLQNHQMTHLIATNGYEWYIFDERWFDKNVYTSTFIKTYKDWQRSKHDTNDFYKLRAKPHIESLENAIECCKIDLRDYANANDAKLKQLYQIVSPAHLLKQEIANDANKLNEPFYRELLYLMGIEERKATDANKKIIDRLPEKQRQEGSLLENTINQLKIKDCLANIQTLETFGETQHEQLYSIALELCITWLNRILFLKLLEAQLVSYHNDDKNYKFLAIDKIGDFDELSELFFEVLAKPMSERTASVNQKFGNIPYLNSSLFEISALEKATFSIESLKDRLEINYFDKTVLVDNTEKQRKGSVKTLKYIFAFLDAYDFNTPSLTATPTKQPQGLINAAVLGLIFEKLNGYKDGSFYTPAFITMYMCQQSIRKAVIQKFSLLLPHSNIATFDDIKEYLDYTNKEKRLCYNELINSIKICDPAVGSGHFLVSALNEIIAIKSELKLLQHPNGTRLKGLSISVENDELVVFDEENDEEFKYKIGKNDRTIPEKQLIQETLFEEKRTIIENCLFGVDINPKSVKICQLRLWIELLKNAYYLNNETHRCLQTLPNIDINIKCGNSLVSKYALTEDLSEVFSKQKFSLQTYQHAVAAYKETNNKAAKADLQRFINDIKEQFRQVVANLDPRRKRLRELLGKRALLDNNIDMFGNKTLDDDQLFLQKQKNNKQITELEDEINDIANNKTYRNAFEWRFEFPEVLDQQGKFVGFDVVIGNPPYFSLSKDPYSKYYKQNYRTFEQSGDIYALFYEFGSNILKTDAYLMFITGSAWLKANYGKGLRYFFVNNVNPTQLIDFSDCHIFDEATVLTTIVQFQKTQNKALLKAIRLDRSQQTMLNALDVFFQNNCSTLSHLTENAWIVANDTYLNIRAKVDTQGEKLTDWDVSINRGVLTGYNDAFYIDEDTRNKLIEKDPKNDEIIVPMFRGRDLSAYYTDVANSYLINTHNGENIMIEHPTKDIIEDAQGSRVKIAGTWKKVNRIERGKGKYVRINRVIAAIDYPSIYEHLSQYRAELEKRLDKGVDWSNLRNCAYLEEFEKPKIIYPNMTKFLPFMYDESGCFGNQKCYIMTGESLKYLLAFFNSKLFKYCFTTDFPELQGNTREINKVVFEQIKVKKISLEAQAPFIEKVDKILAIKKENPAANTTQIEAEIDEMVFDLYALSQTERRAIVQL